MKTNLKICLFVAAGLTIASAASAQKASVPQVNPVTPPTVNVPQGTMQVPNSPSAGAAQKPQQSTNTSGTSSGSVNKQEEQKTNLSAATIASLMSGSDSSFLNGLLGLSGNTIAQGSVAKPNATDDLLAQILRSLESIQNQGSARDYTGGREYTEGQSGATASGSVQKPGSGVISSGSVPKPGSGDVISSGSIPKPGTGSQLRPGQPSEDSRPADSRILRFRVNGYNLLDTCKTIYFSKPAADGSFLLTGDRKYASDGKMREETFYLLFKKSKILRDGSVEYSVAVDVSQDYTNRYSFLYQLADRSPVTAVQTGNMIVLRTDDPSWRMDVLIDYAY